MDTYFVLKAAVLSCLSAFDYLVRCVEPIRLPLDVLGPFSTTLGPFISRDSSVTAAQSQALDKISSDFVGLTTKLARSISIVLVVEDIHKAPSPIRHFLKHLCLRAADLPIRVICTGRTSSSIPPAIEVMRSLLNEDFRSIKVAPLTDAETQRLSQLVVGGINPRASKLEIHDGNPLFVDALRSNSTKSTSLIDNALDWMLSQIASKELKLVEALSIIHTPVTPEELGAICAVTVPIVHERLRKLESLGLIRFVGSRALLRPQIGTAMLKSIGPRSKIQISRRIFDVLRFSDHPLPDVARYAFDSGMKSEAAELYRGLAMKAVEGQQYKTAVGYFKEMAKCGGRASLALKERTTLAWVYHQTGKVGLARRMYHEILDAEPLHHDPELLSLVQSRLAAVLDKTRPEDRIALHRAAIKSLSHDSAELPKRYVQLCCSLMRIGDIHGAAEALEQVEELLPKNPRVLLAKALLLLHQSEFAAAVHCLETANQNDVAAANNLAIGFEHLGQLNRARKLLIESYQKAVRTGHVYLEILALSNLGSINAKLGNLSMSRSLCEEACTTLNRLRSKSQDVDSEVLLSVHADATVQHILSGEYKRASISLRRSRPIRGAAFALDRLFCELVHCEFYARLGQRKQVEAKLKELAANPLFGSPFFQVEKTLLESRIGRHAPEKAIAALKDGLLASERLGTLYQRCQLLNELARVSHELNKEAAVQYAKDALSLARRHGYRLLGAHAQLLIGMSAAVAAQKQRYLYSAFQDASEIGLRELIAESAYQIGAFQLSLKNFVTAQEYLMRSISVVEDIAEGVPDRFRPAYLALGPHRKALQALKVCNPEVQKLIYVKCHQPRFWF